MNTNAANAMKRSIQWNIANTPFFISVKNDTIKPYTLTGDISMQMNATATLSKIIKTLGFQSLQEALDAELSYELALSKEEGFDDFSEDVSRIIEKYNHNEINMNGVVAQLDELSKENNKSLQDDIASDAGYQ